MCGSSYNASTRGCGNNSPASATVVAEVGMILVRTTSAMAEGTPLRKVTSLRAGWVPSWRMFSATMILPPKQSGQKISKIEISNDADVEKNTPDNSAGVYSCCAQATSAVTQ